MGGRPVLVELRNVRPRSCRGILGDARQNSIRASSESRKEMSHPRLTPRSSAQIELRLLVKSPRFIRRETEETGGGRILGLLTYLVLGPDDVTRDELYELLWDPEAGKDSQRAFRELLSRARAVLPEGAISSAGRTITIDRSIIQCDVVAFRTAVLEGRLEDAVSLYEADFMTGASIAGASQFNEWVDAYGRQLRREFIEALRNVVESRVAIGDHSGACEYAERLWRFEPDDTESARIFLETLVLTRDAQKRRASIRAIEAHFEGEVPPDVARLVKEVQSIKPASYPSEPPQRSDTPAIQGTTTPRFSEKRRLLLAVVGLAAVVVGLATASVLIVSGTTHSSKSPAHVFGGGGTLVIRTIDGKTRAIRFVGPNATDTVPVTVHNIDSLIGWNYRYSRHLNAVAHQCGADKTDERIVCVRYLNDGSTLQVGPSVGENRAMGWSPDGSWLLIQSGHGSGRNYNYEIYAWNPKSREAVRLSADPFQSTATWSPDGSRIALVSQRPQGDSVQIRSVDGIAVADYQFHGVTSAHWSPDGRAVLFVEHADSLSTSSLSWSLPGQPRRDVPIALERPGYLSWSPDSKAIAVSGSVGDTMRLVVCDLPDCNTPKLVVHNVVGSIWIHNETPRFLKRIILSTRTDRVVLGERVRLRLRAVDQHGQAYKAPHLNFTVIPHNLAWLDSALVLHTMQAGKVRVVANAGGWASDTIDIVIDEPMAPRVIVAEDWERGIDTTKWKPFGAPLPSVINHGGARVFRNNGDDKYPSGVVSHQSVSLADGITLEWRQQTPLTGDYWQEIWIDLTPFPTDSFKVGPGEPYPPASHVGIRTPLIMHQPPVPALVTGCNGHVVPYPTRLQDRTWHHLVYQVHPDRSCEFIVDGVVVDRGVSALSRTGRTRLVIGGRSYNTDVLIDDVVLYNGLRWTTRADGHAVVRKP